MKPPFPFGADFSGADRNFNPWEPPPVPSDKLRQWGLVLFLISLSSLFAASLLAYVLVRTVSPLPEGLDRGRVHLPWGLGVSTAVLLLCGGVIVAMQRAIRRGQISQLGVLIPLAWCLSLGFLAIQIPSVVLLIKTHLQSKIGSDGIVYTLIVLHALHVVGGLVPLTRLMTKSMRHTLTLNDFGSVRSCAMYWHFLEVVWCVMLLTMYCVR